MEPKIQYAKTEDGVNIAYTTTGEGTPLVRMFGVGGFQSAFEQPETRKWLGSLNNKLILYDGRNFGLSSKSQDYSLDAHARDMDAVVEALGLNRFAVYGSQNSGPIAIAYAAVHPKRVSHLVLFCANPYGDVGSGEHEEIFRKLAQVDWKLYTRIVAQLTFDFDEGQHAKRLAEHLHESFTADEWLAVLDGVRALDARPLLERVECPTLVLQRKNTQAPSVETAQLIAAQIPDAQLVILEGDSIFPTIGDVNAVATAINEFLADEPGVTGAANADTQQSSASFATILFTDMASSTTLADQLGDAKAQEVRRAHNDIVRDSLKAHSGSEIKHTGDGIMASFTTASSALDAAIAIQRGVAQHKEERPDSPLGVYVGINAGEPIAEDDDLFGTSINLAARICDHAEAGQILAANVVRELAAGKDFLFSDLGDTELRGFEDPVKLWELRWRESD